MAIDAQRGVEVRRGRWTVKYRTPTPSTQWAKFQNFVQKIKIRGFYLFTFSQSKIFKGEKITSETHSN
jgi:hypothetical protein